MFVPPARDDDVPDDLYDDEADYASGSGAFPSSGSAGDDAGMASFFAGFGVSYEEYE